ncbi:lytic polysaccharide monooxygenase [Streptomyces sp. NPDC015232]|uniref:lytic polysaccharide monooxygenase n=1 Tax=unclassified Streptomyces TaxID=2593676 RepID=UPI0036FCB467
MTSRTTSRRTAAVVVSATVLALAGPAAGTAFAHGSMTDPVSRVAGCHAEGPESPESAACRAAVAAGGTQALYDWNGVNIANAAGRHRAIIPDGELCSAGNEKFRGLDLARADWPATALKSGPHAFRYKGTAPHRGTFELYVTKDGYDPSKPLRWSDLEAEPFARVVDPGMSNGDYVFTGTVPEKSGRHLIYSIWQRSDSPEAFYACSDVVFGKDTGGAAPAPVATPTPTATPTPNPSSAPAAAPTEAPTAGHAEHTGHPAAPASGAPASPAAPAPQGAASGEELAETGGDAAVPYLVAGGAGVLAVGAAVLFVAGRRRHG